MPTYLGIDMYECSISMNQYMSCVFVNTFGWWNIFRSPYSQSLSLYYTDTPFSFGAVRRLKEKV